MSFMPQIAPINSNQNLYSKKSLVNFDLDDNNDKLPKWLLEFDSYSRSPKESNNSTQTVKVSRPLTENNQLNRPKWFEELSSKRRMSDIYSMSPTGTMTEFTDELFEIKDISRKPSIEGSISHESPVKESLHSTNNFRMSKLSPDFKADEFLFSANDSGSISSLKLTDSRHSSSNDSKSSFNLQDVDNLDEEIFSFSTPKSIDNQIKLNEMLGELDEFVIPEMPSGSELRLTLIDNWGDDNYIGLNGIEILDPNGNRPAFKNIYLEDRNKCRIDTLPDLKKLIDSVYRTHDDSHIWFYRMTKKQQLPIQIVFHLEKPLTMALIRLWNYNKSRIHSYRGIRLLQIRLNDQMIFSGEIAKATGDLTGSVEDFGDTILFTTNEAILEQISYHDFSFQELLMEQMNENGSI